MNKAKAYQRLKKKQQRAVLDWSGASQRNNQHRLPLRDLKQIIIEEINLTFSLNSEQTMFGLRSFDPLKSVAEVEDFEAEGKVDFVSNSTTLPNIDTSNTHSRKVTAKVDSIRRPGTTGNENNTYTLLQAKLDALILPNPQKRKAVRSFSGSSSDFHGRKVFNPRKSNSIMKQAATNKSIDSNTSGNLIQFPIASKMRQLLTVEQPELPTSLNTESPPVHLASKDLDKKKRAKEFSKAAKFYFPSYANQKEKGLRTTAAHDKSSSNLSFITTGKNFAPTYHTPKPRAHLTKQVSFIDERNKKPLTRLRQSAPQLSLPSNMQPAPIPTTNSLSLTSKNLEMFNTATINSTLSAPSEEDTRIMCWIKERQHFGNSQYDAIPETDENMKSASPMDNNSSSATSLT